MQAGIPLHFGKKLRGIEVNGAQGVTVTFEDGTTATGDFLVGADGIHSRVRQLINPDAPKPSYTRLVSTGGFMTGLNVPPTRDTQHFVFGKRAFFGYHVRSSGEIYWFNNHGRAQEPGRSELTESVSEDWKQRLLEMHRGDMPLINDIIRSSEGGIGGYPIYDIPPQPVAGGAGGRRCTCRLAQFRAGRILGDGGCGHAGEVPARCLAARAGVCDL